MKGEKGERVSPFSRTIHLVNQYTTKLLVTMKKSSKESSSDLLCWCFDICCFKLALKIRQKEKDVYVLAMEDSLKQCRKLVLH